MTDQTETPDLAELRRLLDAANSERVMSASLEMDYSLMRKSTRALFIAATNALPALLDAAAERDALAAKVERVRALHRPAYNDATRSPMCEDCGGKAGVHPCGCWAEDDYEFVCAVCNQGTKNQSVPWPCPTVRILDEEPQP